jgi:hypothetical protein
MRLLPGQPADLVGKDITSFSLTNAAINNPDVLPRVYQAFYDEEYSPLSAILAEKGYFTKGLREGTWTSKFRTMGSNHIMYPIASSQKRKSLFVSNTTGITFYCAAYPTKPGYRKSIITVYLNNNWTRPNEIIELNDNKTQLFAYDQAEPIEVDGAFKYDMMLWTNDPEDYCDPLLLAEGSECSAVMTAYEQDYSETGSQKYTFDGWGHAWLTLQRVMMSYSGTAAAMSTDKSWYQYANARGEKTYGYIEHARKEMMKRAIKYHEYQLLFGKTSMTTNGDVFMHDKRGREIMAGSGLLYGIDGAFERPLTSRGWTFEFLKTMLRDMDIRSGREGHKEIVLIGGFENIASFNDMMLEKGFKTFNNMVQGDVGKGGERGINLDYSWFQYMDIRIIPLRYRWFDSEDRAQKYLSNGAPRGSWDSLMIPIGITAEGDNMIELVQLRPPVLGTVNGMNKGGDSMASSVDGASTHYLWQTGVVSRTNIHRIFMPWTA